MPEIKFNFSNTQLAVIYAEDDSEYLIGNQTHVYELTEQEKKTKEMFLKVVGIIKKHDTPVNIDRLLEAIRDYCAERRLENEFRRTG